MKKLCRDCEAFVKKFKKWDEKKVSDVALVSGAECKKCRMSYTVYKGMIQAIPFATKEELKEMGKQFTDL